MRFATLILVALFFCGCAKERAQSAADARAGLEAAASHTDPIGQTILAGVSARLPATADVNSSQWPTPTMTAKDIDADPHKYETTAPPEPAVHFWQSPKLLAALSLGGFAVLSIIQRAGPLIPYIGPILGRFKPLQPLLDLLWNSLSHADEVSADRARSLVAAEAGNLLPLAQAGNAKPELIDALKALAKA